MKEDFDKIDHAAIQVSQITLIGLNLLAFVLDAPWLVAGVAAVMAIGTLLKKPGFAFVYHKVLKPLHLVKPQVRYDHAEPHRFAQGLGSVVLLGGVASLYIGFRVLGWGLVWLVIALAGLNAFAGFCAGCMVYYWLARWHLPGFHKQPPPGTFPGARSPLKVENEL